MVSVVSLDVVSALVGCCLLVRHGHQVCNAMPDGGAFDLGQGHFSANAAQSMHGLEKTMTDAIEPWVTDEIHRKLLLERTLELHRAYMHQTALHVLEAGQLARTQTTHQLQAQHSTISQQHVDVET